jgi:8-amino-3,8-dideoxy-alpha-D-manno-octulosonate transaminase
MNKPAVTKDTVAPSASRSVPFPLRARPTLGLGGALIGKEEEELVLDVLRRREPFRYYGHDPQRPPPMAATLEKEFREMMGTRFALAVTSGTAALEVALGALGIGPGDEVIVPAWSWISCFTSIVRLGALPVLAEIDETFCLAPGEIARLRTPRTKAAMVIHFQGVAADMDAILAEAKQAGIAVVEDCAESPGASYHGQRVGSLGDIGTFSFQFHKSMTGGEGGMVVTNNARLYERAVRMHDLGQFRPHHQQFVTPVEQAFCGSQFRMSEVTAAIALAQLRKLDQVRSHCRQLQDRVLAGIRHLQGLGFRRIPDPAGDSGFEIYFCVDTPERASRIKQRLNELNVNCQQTTGTYCHYAQEFCRQRLAHAPGASPFSRFTEWPAQGYRVEDFPRTESLIHRFIALPLGVLYTKEDADYISEAVRSAHHELCEARR